jgi:hypothetical protein
MGLIQYNKFFKTDHDKVLELHAQKNTNKEISDKLNTTLYMVEKILSYYELTPVKNVDKIDHQIVIDLYNEHRKISEVAKILEIEEYMVDKILIRYDVTKRSVTLKLDSTEVIRDYLECRDVNVVAQKYNVSLSPIIKILKNNGIKRKKNLNVYKRVVKNGHRVKVEIDVNYVIQLYKELGTIAAVCRELHVKDYTVRKVLLSNNVKLNVTLKYTNVGDVFDYLTVIKELQPKYTTGGASKKILLCECKCGNTVERTSSSLKTPHNKFKSCGCHIEERKQKNLQIKTERKNSWLKRLSDAKVKREEREERKLNKKPSAPLKYIKGYKHHRLTILSEVGTGNNMVFTVECECGTIKDIRRKTISQTKSCGCLQRERQREGSTVHGLCKKNNPERRKWYDRWRSMVRRCYNVNFNRYMDYGGRGITVCDRWREPNGVGCKNYIEDIHTILGPQPSSEHSLDRIDNDGIYEITNMRWATNSEQTKNQRRNIKSKT